MNKNNYYDPITTLASCDLLMDRLNQVLFVAWRQKAQFSILYVVIDRWQALSREYEQAELKQLALQVGQKFTLVLRKEDTIAQVGDGEFAILLSHIGSNSVAKTTDVCKIVAKLNQVFEQVFWVADQALLLSMSLGVAMIPDDGETAAMIMSNAENVAKDLAQQGGDGFVFYNKKFQHQSEIRALTIKQLQQALETDAMHVYFQAMVNDNGCVFGAEALLYWQHPEQGLVGPEQFIPLAEECGLIEQIGARVLSLACQQFIEFSPAESNSKLTHLAVNISAQQFYAPSFYPMVEQVLKQTGMIPEQLVLEITEDLMQQDREHTRDILMQVSALGVAFAIDDFGAGYSSLVSLEDLPLQQLKIDQSLIDSIEQVKARKIISIIVEMAGHLNLELVAKGIETKQQQQTLHELGCLSYQGFLFNKPMIAADFKHMLAQQNSSFAVS